MKRLAIAAIPLGLAILLGSTATAIGATIRVEGPDATLLSERSQASAETRVADRAGGEIRTVSGPSALGQLVRAGERSGLPIRVSFSEAFGPLAAVVERIGPHDQGTAFEGPGYWLFKINHRSAPASANQQMIRRSDEVLWYFTENFAARELVLTAPHAPVRAGRRFVVTVHAYDAEGARKPAQGARVVYAAHAATTDRRGRASFRATTRVRGLRATRDGDIRSAIERVCGYRGAATECSPRLPFGGSLRVAANGRTVAGWRASTPLLRRIAAGDPPSGPVAISWRGRSWRGAGAKRMASGLVGRYLS